MFSNFMSSVCKIGQGADCCRYITCGPDGFECAKVGSLKSAIDARVDSMNAKSDNCEGVNDLGKRS